MSEGMTQMRDVRMESRGTASHSSLGEIASRLLCRASSALLPCFVGVNAASRSPVPASSGGFSC